MSLSIQAGACSLTQIGLSISDIGVLVQFSRSFGNWLRVTPNDEELFNTINEDYGIVLRRHGLVDLVEMENCWSRQLHLIHQGAIIRDNAKSRKEEDGQLGGFSWLMVAIVMAIDPCLTPDEVRDLLLQLFVKLLRRDDAQDVSEALQMQIQTNIESWRSTGEVRGLRAPLCTAMKDCRLTLTGCASIPHLTRAERGELFEFLTWLMAGETEQFTMVSATLYAVASALHRAEIRLSLGSVDHTLAGMVVVHYANEGTNMQSLQDVLQSELRSIQGAEVDNTVPPIRISYLSGNPVQMIETLPCSRQTKNDLRKFWFKGAQAAARISLRAVARLRRTGIKYLVKDYDPCVSAWPGRLTDLSSEHFPVDSEMLLLALHDLMDSLSDQTEDWLYRSAKVDGGINDLDNSFTEQQLNAFLCFQSLVFGYWYRLLEPWVSMQYIEHEVYFYGVWGFRDTYLLVMLRTAATHFRLGLAKPHEGLSREEMLQVLATMFTGRSKHRSERPRKQKPILSHGMVAILDKISIVSMSLLKVSDDPQQQACFAVLSLPLINVLPDRDGELWTGDAAGIKLSPRTIMSEIITRKLPREQWSVHPKMMTVGGRLNNVVMMARCGGVTVGVFNPADADAALLRAQENRSGHLVSKEPGIVPCKSFLDTTEHHFKSGIIHRPMRSGDIVLVHSYRMPVMRYAAAGFYAQQAHMVVAYPDQQEAVRAIRAQMCGLPDSCGYGVIIV